MAILYKKPAAWESYQRNLPFGYSVISSKEALDPKNSQILTEARKFINRTVGQNKPIGYKEYKTIGGRKILMVIEPHYHEPNGPVKPWGWHKGCTVFVPAASESYWSFLYDDGPTMTGEQNIKPWIKYMAMGVGASVMLIAPVVGSIVGGSLLAADLLKKYHEKHDKRI